jgi:hypothetical protein
MNLRLTDEQTELLLAELDRIIENDRYPLSPRIQRCERSSIGHRRRLANRRPHRSAMNRRAKAGIGDDGSCY